MLKPKVAVIRWPNIDEICVAIANELSILGYQPRIFYHNTPPPSDADIVFTFAPYGNLLHIRSLLSGRSTTCLPTWVHWNTEGIPDPRIPWCAMKFVAYWRSWVGRLLEPDYHWENRLVRMPFLWVVNRRMMRFKYLGDYRFAHRQGWLNVLADSSAIYARFRTEHGLPTIYAPWGSVPHWSNDLRYERDIDVLWMGVRGTRRRSYWIDAIRQKLAKHGVRMYVADNIENPFIFGAERIALLNRAKITLNIARTWYDDNFSRFAMAAPNRSLIVSEKLLPHCPSVQSGTHYASAPIDVVADTILYYLEHATEREQLIENAYQLVTTTLTFGNTIKTIMQATNQARQNTLCP